MPGTVRKGNHRYHENRDQAPHGRLNPGQPRVQGCETTLPRGPHKRYKNHEPYE